MSRTEQAQLEKMIEVIVRSIPKEESQAKLYRETSKLAQREMNRMLFEKLASQGEEHVKKLRATLDILAKELKRMREPGYKPEETSPATCMAPHEFNVNIRQTLLLARELKKLAEKGLKDANDPSCQKMYETISTMSSQMKEMAEDEVEGHIIKEKWN